MIREKFNKIVGWYNDLDSIKKLIVTFFGLIILIILVNILGNINFEEGIIEYNWDSGNNLVSNLTVNNDREIYLKSNVILKNLITEKKGNNKTLSRFNNFDKVVTIFI